MSPGDASAANRKATGKGLVEIFTGDGKGKTTAALGIALRASGHGLKVFIICFMKGDFPYGERKALSQLPNIKLAKFGLETFVDPNNVTEVEKEEARKALQMAKEVIFNNEYDIVVLDEINVATAWNLISTNEVIKIIKGKPKNVELILTGRYADDKLIELADLVTNMIKVKHPYDKGILARKGIDY
jgi:cob(I)alamin adenosyltransferase